MHESEKAIEAGRVGIEQADREGATWRNPPTTYSLAKAAVTAALPELEAEWRERLEAEADKLERQNLEGDGPSDLTAATVRAVKAQGIRGALKATHQTPCEHDWIDIRNRVIESGEMCRRCNAVRPGNVQSPEKPGGFS